MSEFRNFLNESIESNAKISREVLMNLPGSKYGKSIQLNVHLEPQMKEIVRLIKKGYHLLKNTKTFQMDIIISPEDLSKLPESSNKYKIGRSTYSKLADYDYKYELSCSNKVTLITVQGDVIGYLSKSKYPEDVLAQTDAQIVYGVTNTLTRDIAKSFADEDGNIEFYSNKSGKYIVAFGRIGTLKTGKSYMFVPQNKKCVPYISCKVYPLKTTLSELFPSSFSKSKFNKQGVFFIK